MCGIAGIFAYRSTSTAVSESEIEAINAQMIPRGPDAGGTWLSEDGRIGLCNRRLAIIDPSDEGVQPMWDVERELVVVFNGEIYNHGELRASLERRGARFHSRTDTEVLLQLYRRDGASMVELLRGMFAFAIWDTRARRLFVARDPYGIKPLYFADDGSVFRFASQVQALVAGGVVSRAIDPAGAAGFFLTGSVPEPFTIRRDIRAVEAGTSHFVEAERGRTSERRYFSISSVFRKAIGEKTLVEPGVFLRERAEESMAQHLVSDVPVAFFLSAGIDSTSLALMARKIAGTAPRTFTLTFSEVSGRREDEAPLAERFARQIGAVHTSRTVSRAEFTADLPRILAAMDQPTIDGINTWFVSKAVHEAGLKVAVSGVGGDELFGSYPSFRNVPRMVRLAQLPGVARMLQTVSRHPKASLIRSHGGTWAGAYFVQRGLFTPDDLPALLGRPEAEEGLQRLDLQELLGRTLDPDPLTAFGRVASLEASVYLRNQLLRDADWAGMAHSVEIRTPLVDAWLLRQTASTLVEHETDCKAALAAPLPAWLRERRKTGFFVPVRDWMDLPEDGTSTRMRSWAKHVFESIV
ncbi:MAG: asparagine synthase (glutamine-hydrolyzing) [Thermoanaerobaculia bacterium]